MLVVNWLLPLTFDPQTNLSLRILDYILIGMPGSPLRKALIDSDLGEDLAGVGMETDLMHLFYSTGLKGVANDNLGQVEELIFATLKKIVAEGLSKDIILAAINTIEFALRENNTGGFPRGLAVMLRALTTWLYGKSPFLLLEFEPVLARIKERIHKEPLFEGLIDKYFLQNNHRTTLILEPDKELEQKLREKEHKRLLQAKESLSAQELQKILEETQKLEQMQATPDSPEALATIPRLKRKDLDKEIKKVPLEENSINDITVLFHPLPTSGIFYVDLGLNIHLLPQKYLSYVPLFGRALLEMGTKFENFVQLTTRIRKKTGGIFAQPLASQILGQQDCTAWLFLRGKALSENLKDLLNIYKDVLLDLNLDNRERFRQILLEEKAGLEESLVPQGHRYVAMRLKARFSEADWATELMSGISYLFFLRYLLDRIENDWDEVRRTLDEMRFMLVHKNGLLLNVTTEDKLWEKYNQDFQEFLTLFPRRSFTATKWQRAPLPHNEAMILPTQVNYVGQAVAIYPPANAFAVERRTANGEPHTSIGSSLVGTRFLRTGPLWEKIRVMGGAYGAFCTFDHLTGVMTFVSYRDPNVLNTLEVFNKAGEFLATNNLSEEEVDKAVIGTIGDMDSYQLPDAKGFSSLLRYLTKMDDQKRQKIRDEILQTNSKDLQNFGLDLDKACQESFISIMGNKVKIEQALKEGLGIENVFSLL
jgi:Zn-dependent M16 (insulinase) family peptidase